MRSFSRQPLRLPTPDTQRGQAGHVAVDLIHHTLEGMLFIAN